MPSPRTRRRPFAVPREIVDAPLEAHRSHLYPVAPPVAAYERMASGELAYEHWLPQSQGQAQWLKDADYGYGPQFGPVESFVQAAKDSGSTLRTVRQHIPPHPQLPWGAVAAQLVEEADWALPTDPSGRVPIGRGIPYPGGLPFEPLAQFTNEPPYPRPEWVRFRDDNRERAQAEIRALQAEYAGFTYEEGWEP